MRIRGEAKLHSDSHALKSAAVDKAHVPRPIKQPAGRQPASLRLQIYSTAGALPLAMPLAPWGLVMKGYFYSIYNEDMHRTMQIINERIELGRWN
jgi:hypothetical protein